jgi:CBS domain-containing protein
MAQSIREVMTENPAMLEADATVDDAAHMMKQQNIGDVLIGDNGTLTGIVTDRDIVTRVLAAGKDAKTTTLRDCCTSDNLQTLAPDASVGDAIQLMEQHAIRRLPIVDNGNPVGIVSLGDLAVERDPESTLADISAAPANS